MDAPSPPMKPSGAASAAAAKDQMTKRSQPGVIATQHIASPVGSQVPAHMIRAGDEPKPTMRAGSPGPAGRRTGTKRAGNRTATSRPAKRPARVERSESPAPEKPITSASSTGALAVAAVAAAAAAVQSAADGPGRQHVAPRGRQKPPLELADNIPVEEAPCTLTQAKQLLNTADRPIRMVHLICSCGEQCILRSKYPHDPARWRLCEYFTGDWARLSPAQQQSNSKQFSNKVRPHYRRSRDGQQQGCSARLPSSQQVPASCAGLPRRVQVAVPAEEPDDIAATGQEGPAVQEPLAEPTADERPGAVEEQSGAAPGTAVSERLFDEAQGQERQSRGVTHAGESVAGSETGSEVGRGMHAEIASAPDEDEQYFLEVDFEMEADW